jgi:PII-like signaling protein
VKEQFQTHTLRIHLGENDKWQSKPLRERVGW